MGIIIESGEFSPTLRRQIAAFIDAFFEEPGFEGEVASRAETVCNMAEPMRAAAAAPSEPLEVPALFEPSESSEAPESSATSEPRKPSRLFASSESSGSSRFKRGNMAEVFDRAFGLFGTSREEKETAAPDGEFDFAGAMPCGDASSLSSWLDQVDEPFSTTLLALIDRKGLTDVDVYKRAHMSRQLFSRIRSDASYRPAKKTVLALAIAMELSLDEMRDLLERAGFALSRSSKRDLIVEYFVTNGAYDLFTINEALYEFDQPLI